MRGEFLTRDVVYVLRWTVFALVLLAIGGIAMLFVRKGAKIKSDADTKPPPDISLPGVWH